MDFERSEKIPFKVRLYCEMKGLCGVKNFCKLEPDTREAMAFVISHFNFVEDSWSGIHPTQVNLFETVIKLLGEMDRMTYFAKLNNWEIRSGAKYNGLELFIDDESLGSAKIAAKLDRPYLKGIVNEKDVDIFRAWLKSSFEAYYHSWG